MPLYDCVLLLMPSVDRRSLVSTLKSLGGLVCGRGGVVTDVKSFGTIHLAFTIKKFSERFNQGQMVQMTMMVPPKFNEELLFLNKDSSILRWIVVKHPGTNWLPKNEYRNQRSWDRVY